MHDAGAERDWSAEAITDPVARLEFKLAQHGLPRPLPERPEIALSAQALDEATIRDLARRRSYRSYSMEEVPLEDFGGLLGALRQIQPEGLTLPKARYPSGGGLYPVQTYLYVKPGRIAGLVGGTYHYDPKHGRLVLLAEGASLDRRIHGEVNRPIFDHSAFSIFLLGRMGAVAPLYPGLARDFCLLEAGYMGQLLMTEATEHQLGLVPLGGLDFDAVRQLFDLEQDHFLVHLFEGGRISGEPVSLESALAEQPPPPPSDIGEGGAKATGKEKIVATAVTAEVTADQLKEYLAAKVPEYMVPPTVVFLDRLPLTANGKIDRGALSRQAEQSAAGEVTAQVERVAPRTEIERRVAELVRDLLGGESIGIGDNFFELGATSVQMIQLQQRIQQDLGLKVEIAALFRNPNVLSLAAALGDGEEETQVEAGQERARRRKRVRRRRGPGRKEER